MGGRFSYKNRKKILYDITRDFSLDFDGDTRAGSLVF